MSQHYLKELEDRFVRYVQIDTQSNENSNQTPSTAKQYDLLRLLESELRALGAGDVRLTDYGCVLATVPPTLADEQIPTIAFMAHTDTTPAFSGTNVKPIVHRNYDGQPIILPDDPAQVLDPQSIPYLKDKIGHDIITASGLTLLGGDDKAGVAIVMTLAAELLRNPRIPHGKIRLCFTPDEEVGRGVANLTPQDLDAQVAYTLDGGEAGEVTYETFSADKALVKITGVSAHTGTAKGQMVNAAQLAAKFVMLLPASRLPETTDGRDGFIHLYKIEGTAAEARLYFILRDFELDRLEAYGALLESIAATLQASEPRSRIECDITPQYRNMRYRLEQDMRPVELAIRAIEQAGLEPIVKPIRGGTDGAGLTAKGIPTPNLFAGIYNVHGPLEWVSLQDMALATQVCINLAQLWAEQRRPP